MIHTTKEQQKELNKNLEKIVSVKEAANLFGVSYNAIMYHILEGSIVATQTIDGMWLVDLASVVITYRTAPPYPGKTCRNVMWGDALGLTEVGEIKLG